VFPDEPHPASASKQANVRNQPEMAALSEKNRLCRDGRYCIFENGCGRLREEECRFQTAYQQIRLWLRPVPPSTGAQCFWYPTSHRVPRANRGWLRLVPDATAIYRLDNGRHIEARRTGRGRAAASATSGASTHPSTSVDCGLPRKLIEPLLRDRASPVRQVFHLRRVWPPKVEVLAELSLPSRLPVH
jgi:hypothetical protein